MMDGKIGSDESSHEFVATGEKKRSAQEHEDNSDDESDEVLPSEQAQGEQHLDRTSRLRREKRLAMNRESARARRKRKKILIETLENQVAELTKNNQSYKNQISDLEKELIAAKQTIQILSRNGSAIAQQQASLNVTHGQMAPQVLVTRGFEIDANDTMRRILEARNQPVMGQNVAVSGGAGQNSTTVEQLLRLEGLGGLQHLPPQSLPSRISTVVPAGSGIEVLTQQRGDVHARFSGVGAQTVVGCTFSLDTSGRGITNR